MVSNYSMNKPRKKVEYEIRFFLSSGFDRNKTDMSGLLPVVIVWLNTRTWRHQNDIFKVNIRRNKIGLFSNEIKLKQRSWLFSLLANHKFNLFHIAKQHELFTIKLFILILYLSTSPYVNVCLCSKDKSINQFSYLFFILLNWLKSLKRSNKSNPF